jgi:hypothetical protein
MSPYAEKLAHARLDALEALMDALKDAESPDEKRRCAVAIFNAPDPCDLDDTIELIDDDSDSTEANATSRGEPHADRAPAAPSLPPSLPPAPAVSSESAHPPASDLSPSPDNPSPETAPPPVSPLEFLLHASDRDLIDVMIPECAVRPQPITREALLTAIGQFP